MAVLRHALNADASLLIFPAQSVASLLLMEGPHPALHVVECLSRGGKYLSCGGRSADILLASWPLI